MSGVRVFPGEVDSALHGFRDTSHFPGMHTSLLSTETRSFGAGETLELDSA